MDRNCGKVIPFTKPIKEDKTTLKDVIDNVNGQIITLNTIIDGQILSSNTMMFVKAKSDEEREDLTVFEYGYGCYGCCGENPLPNCPDMVIKSRVYISNNMLDRYVLKRVEGNAHYIFHCNV